MPKEKLQIWNIKLQNLSDKIASLFIKFNQLIEVTTTKPFEPAIHAKDFYLILKDIVFAFLEFQYDLLSKNFTLQEINILTGIDYNILSEFYNKIQSIDPNYIDNINNFYYFFKFYKDKITILSSISPKIKNKLDLIINDTESYIIEYINAITIDQQSINFINYLNKLARESK